MQLPMGTAARRRSQAPKLAGIVIAVMSSAGCANVPMKEAGTLSSYGRLGAAQGTLSKSRTYVDGQGLAAIRTVRIAPAGFSPEAARRVPLAADRTLVTNALDRSLCIALSDRYQMVAGNQPADLVVRATVTELVPTDKTAAGVAKVVSLGSSAVLPVGVPRLPIGLGGLAVEAEAVDKAGVQRAAMVWSRGANSIENSPRISDVGDAYALASKFANEFSRVLVTGHQPEGLDLSLPSAQRTKSWFGGAPKYAACDAFGRAPGVAGAIAGQLGAPPGWTDKTAASTAAR